MLDVGFGELLLVLIVSLIVFGPQRLPEIGAKVGRAIYEFRRASADMTGLLMGNEPQQPAAPPEPPPPGVPCAACGAFVRTDQRFCTICGTDQETWAKPDPEPQRSPADAAPEAGSDGAGADGHREPGSAGESTHRFLAPVEYTSPDDGGVPFSIAAEDDHARLDAASASSSGATDDEPAPPSLPGSDASRDPRA